MDDWDNIDWDEKVEDIVKNQQKNQIDLENERKEVEFLGANDDGNYFEANQEKKRQQSKRSHQTKPGSSKVVENFIQPYSWKDLKRIRENLKGSAISNVIYETFGQFERFLLTHQDLTNDALVELLIIDASLLEIPFHAHNQLLLRNISQLESFWTQLIQFLEEFLSTKYQDMKFLLTVDMNGFFDNIESLLHNLIVGNFFSEKMEKVFQEILTVMEKFAENKWSCVSRLRRIQENYARNREIFKIYDVSFLKK